MITKVKDGKSWNFSLDIDKIVQMENEDPSFNFFEDVSKMGENFRLSTLARLCTYIGYDVKTLLTAKFTVEEISEILSDCFRELGFISEE